MLDPEYIFAMLFSQMYLTPKSARKKSKLKKKRGKKKRTKETKQTHSMSIPLLGTHLPSLLSPYITSAHIPS
jgi:hypothetical protein